MNGFDTLTIKNVEKLTHSSRRVEFTIPDKIISKFKFQPGQYITLRKRFDNREERRSYSICSSSNEPIAIGVKRVEGGLFSNYIFNELKPGMSLDVMAPNGRFIQKDEKKFLMVAAGSGITPIMSIISSNLKYNPSSSFTLIYGNKTTDNIMFQKELENLKDTFLEKLNVIHILSKEFQDVDVLNGRIDKNKIKLLLSRKVIDLDVDGAFICGPNSMINNVRNVLLQEGFEKGKIHSEKFYLGSQPISKPEIKSKSFSKFKANIEIILDGLRKKFIFENENSNIVDAAQSNGIDVPFSCKGGMCCTCRCKITKGEVTMNANYSLEDWEINSGFVLACQAVPKSKEVILDFDAS